MKLRLILATAATVLTLLPVTAEAATPDDTRIQQVLDEMAGVGGLAARIVDGGQVRDFKAGVADPMNPAKPPVPDRARFRVGSTTKSFVATVVLQLVNEGRLDLDAPARGYFPHPLLKNRAITIRHLLNHTSGIPDYDGELYQDAKDIQDLLDRVRYTTYTLRDVLKLARKSTDDVPPFGSFGYANTNYTLLALVIERVTGRAYAEEVTRRVLRPLGLSDTYFPGTDPTIVGPHTEAYIPVGPDVPLANVTDWNPSAFNAAGELISTPADLAAFTQALLSGALLPAHLLRQMVTGAEWGLGIEFWKTSCGKDLFGHTGAAIGVYSMMFGTRDGSRQFAVAFTPGGSKGASMANAQKMVDAAFCS
ncbi:serine hydrolase domain-containing protein [Nonomuraea sp. NPDC050310]|uniref:serine hydrolase domain-containing protein n=1 Tax=Nonomuraea sp. NPDC050310 TaxID=3154935 RepID=UPI0033E31D44